MTTKMTPRYPNVVVKLSGRPRNVWLYLKLIVSAMRQAGLGDEVVYAFTRDVTQRPFTELGETLMSWVTIK